MKHQLHKTVTDHVIRHDPHTQHGLSLIDIMYDAAVQPHILAFKVAVVVTIHMHYRLTRRNPDVQRAR